MNSTAPFSIILEHILCVSVSVSQEFSLCISFSVIFKNELAPSRLSRVEVAKFFLQNCKKISAKMKNISLHWTVFIMHPLGGNELILYPSRCYVLEFILYPSNHNKSELILWPSDYFVPRG